MKAQWNVANGIVLYEDDLQEPPLNANFLRFTIINGESEQASLGPTDALERSFDMMSIQVFTVAGQGGQKATTLADLVADIFRRQDLAAETGGRVLCRSAKIRILGSSDNASHFQVNVSIPFMRDLFI